MNNASMDTTSVWGEMDDTPPNSSGKSVTINREYTGPGSAARIFEWYNNNRVDASGYEPVIRFVLNSSRPNVITR
jgi:hypothetical protein